MTIAQIPNPTRLHVAAAVGPDGQQRCQRCAIVLKDLRPGLELNTLNNGAYPVGARVEISLYHQAMVLSQVGSYCGAVDELTFVSYRENRRLSPHVTPTQWKRVFVEADVDVMEERYQAERDLREPQWDGQDHGDACGCVSCNADAFAELVR